MYYHLSLIFCSEKCCLTCGGVVVVESGPCCMWVWWVMRGERFGC